MCLLFMFIVLLLMDGCCDVWYCILFCSVLVCCDSDVCISDILLVGVLFIVRWFEVVVVIGRLFLFCWLIVFCSVD